MQLKPVTSAFDDVLPLQPSDQEIEDLAQRLEIKLASTRQLGRPLLGVHVIKPDEPQIDRPGR